MWTLIGGAVTLCGGVVLGVMFNDKLVWAKDKIVSAYDWVKAKF